MIIVNCIGGLGNQMFQYAFGFALSKKLKKEFKLDILGFEGYKLRRYELDCFDLNVSFASKKEIQNIKYEKTCVSYKLVRKILKKPRKLSAHYYLEKKNAFDEQINFISDDIYFEGYWQSEKYFAVFRKELLEQFRLKKPLNKQTNKLKKEIEATVSVSLHIRRGDYVTNQHTNSVHGTCSLHYYKKAIETILIKYPQAKFYIFSDDIDWSKLNLGFIKARIFIENNNISDCEEMYLMSQCKHNIVANSSFSWWGAWLNQNIDKIVIAPKKWFKDESINTADLIPESWVRI